jgi:hypothetical protein
MTSPISSGDTGGPSMRLLQNVVPSRRLIVSICLSERAATMTSSVATGIPWIPDPTELVQTISGGSTATRSCRKGVRA